jgi:hypothetical protein
MSFPSLAQVTGNMPMPGGGSSIIVNTPFEENLSELTIKRQDRAVGR